jgi:hypothetical protein
MASQFSELGSRSELQSNSNAPSILAVSGVFTFIAMVVVVLRVYVRAAMLKCVGLDDYVIVAAMVSNLHSQSHTRGVVADRKCRPAELGYLLASSVSVKLVLDDTSRISVQRMLRQSTIGYTSIHSLRWSESALSKFPSRSFCCVLCQGVGINASSGP